MSHYQATCHIDDGRKKKIFSLPVNQHNMNPTSIAKANQKCLWMPSVAKEVTTGGVMLHNTFEKGGHMRTGRRGRGKRAGAGTTWITALRMQSTDGEDARARSRSDPVPRCWWEGLLECTPEQIVKVTGDMFGLLWAKQPKKNSLWMEGLCTAWVVRQGHSAVYKSLFVLLFS